MAHNMYRVGDFVYFEMSAGAPYQIRKIEELNKVNQSGAVEAKVTCYYRRRDIPSYLHQLADKHTISMTVTNSVVDVKSPLPEGSDDVDSEDRTKQNDLSDQEMQRVRHRELFVSRQVETLPATHIRGKCGVSLLNETESPASYLHKDDAFFYSLKYDPAAKTLLADRGEIRVGANYQAVIPDMLAEGEKDGRQHEKLAELEWQEEHGLAEEKVDEFWLLARSVGTMARAYDSTSAVRQPNLLMSAAAASRDATHLRALQVLHRCNYDFNKAVSELVPSRSPMLCRDEMEEWSASEGNLFEEAMDKYGKNFHDIRNDFLPWKTYPALVEYYYMWKTTDRYVQQKRMKAAEADTRLKQVYIPAYSRPSPAMTCDSSTTVTPGCECCSVTDTPLWYANDVGNRYRLCTDCWNYWKRYGGMKFAKEVTSVQSAQSELSGSDSGHLGMDTSSLRLHSGTAPLVSRVSQQRSFLFHSPLCLRVARRACKSTSRQRDLARHPFVCAVEEELRDEYESSLHTRGEKDAVAVSSFISRCRSETLKRRFGQSGEKMNRSLLNLHAGRLPPIPAILHRSCDAGVKRKVEERREEGDKKRRGRVREEAMENGQPEAPAEEVKVKTEDRVNGVVAESEVSRTRRSSRGAVKDSSSGKGAPTKREREEKNGKAAGPTSAELDSTLCEIYVVNDGVRKARRSLPRGQLRKLSRQPFSGFDLAKSKV